MEMALEVERRIVGLGLERARLAVQLRMLMHRRCLETGERGKLVLLEGNNPDHG